MMTSRVSAFLIVFGLSIIGSLASPDDTLNPSNSFLEVGSPHCSDIVDEYIRLETASGKRDWTCAAMANKLWTLFAGLTAAKAMESGVQRHLIGAAVSLAKPSRYAPLSQAFNLQLRDCDNNSNKYCECKAGATSCDFALQPSTFYIVEIGIDGKKKQFDGAISHNLLVYVHADGTSVSIYQASAGVTPLIRKSSTLADFTQGLSSLILLQKQTLVQHDSDLLDQFCLLDPQNDADGSKYLNSVGAVAIGGGYSDANCQNLVQQMAQTRKVMCGPSLIGCKGKTKKVPNGATKKVWIFNVKEKDVVCDC